MRLLQEVAKLCSQQCLVIHGAAGRASLPPSAESSWPRPVPGLAGREPLAGSPRSDDSGVPPAEWAAWVLQPSHPFIPGTKSPSSPPKRIQGRSEKLGPAFLGGVTAVFTANKSPLMAAQLGSHTQLLY